MSSNPFAPDAPQALNPWARDAVEQRYPSLGVSAPSPPVQQQQQHQQHQYGMMYPQQTGMPQQHMMPYPQQQPQQQYHQQQPMHSGYQPQTGFQPSSAFGQQLASEVNSYAGVQDLDPYGSIPSTFQQQSQPQPQPPSQSQPTTSASSSSGKEYGAHPRVILDNSKAQLESWQPQAWAALLRRIDALQSSWTQRRSAVLSALENQQGRILQPDEQHRFEQVLKDAEDKVDGLAAGRFQIEEVQNGYRHSTDAQSKSRVRQALNDVVRSWPDWPEDLYTGPVGGGQYGGTPAPQPQPQPQYTGMSQPQPQPYQQQQQMPYGAQPQPQQQMYTGMPQSSMSMGMTQPQPQPQAMGMQPTGMMMMPQQQQQQPQMGMPQQQQQPYGMPQQYGQMYGQQWGGM